MTKEERILKVIHRDTRGLDYLPSQISFADRTKMEELSKKMGFSTIKELDDYLENHLYLTWSYDDAPLFFRNSADIMKDYEKKGYCGVDLERGIVYDRWGIGIAMNTFGFVSVFHPLMRGQNNKKTAQYMPSDFNRKVLFAKDDEEAIGAYQPPDPNKEDNTLEMENALKTLSGDHLVFTSGYVGIYERAFHLLGFEKFMILLVENPKLLGKFLDKITGYKVKMAKKTVEMGFKVGHTGDDLGTQQAPLFSLKMFRATLKPRMQRLWNVWKNAGIPLIFHSCGNIIEFIPDLIEMGLDVLEPVQPCMDLKYLKREFGKDLVFWGGIDTQYLLPYETPGGVKKMAADTIRILGEGGGYIIAPAQEIMPDVPIENVKALVETINIEREKVLNL